MNSERAVRRCCVGTVRSRKSTRMKEVGMRISATSDVKLRRRAISLHGLIFFFAVCSVGRHILDTQSRGVMARNRCMSGGKKRETSEELAFLLTSL